MITARPISGDSPWWVREPTISISLDGGPSMVAASHVPTTDTRCRTASSGSPTGSHLHPTANTHRGDRGPLGTRSDGLR
jgi:hypothetical protein